MPAEDPYALATFPVNNGTPLRQGLGFTARSVSIDNNTSANLFCEAAGRYVGRNAVATFSIPPTRHAVILWQSPGGYAQATAIPAEAAQVTYYAQPIPPGASAAIPAPQVPWNINNAPAAGSTASVTLAPSPGVTHIGDSFEFDLAQNGNTAGEVGAVVRDGASGVGAILWKGLLAVDGVAGHSDHISPGAGMNLRGTAGNAMTIEFQSALAGVFQSVSLTGHDA